MCIGLYQGLGWSVSTFYKSLCSVLHLRSLLITEFLPLFGRDLFLDNAWTNYCKFSSGTLLVWSRTIELIQGPFLGFMNISWGFYVMCCYISHGLVFNIRTFLRLFVLWIAPLFGLLCLLTVPVILSLIYEVYYFFQLLLLLLLSLPSIFFWVYLEDFFFYVIDFKFLDGLLFFLWSTLMSPDVSLLFYHLNFCLVIFDRFFFFF